MASIINLPDRYLTAAPVIVTSPTTRCGTTLVQRLLCASDNAFVYRHNRCLRELLEAQRIEHRFIRPRRPQTNGKVERYQQTLKREWGLGRVYRSSDHRANALSHRLDYDNTRRPHSSLGGRPPISRVHNLPRQDT